MIVHDNPRASRTTVPVMQSLLQVQLYQIQVQGTAYFASAVEVYLLHFRDVDQSFVLPSRMDE